MAAHNSLSGDNLHEPFHRVASSDPGAVGAGKYWLDTSVEPYVLKRRNSGDTDWVTVGADGGGGGGGGGAPSGALDLSTGFAWQGQNQGGFDATATMLGDQLLLEAPSHGDTGANHLRLYLVDIPTHDTWKFTAKVSWAWFPAGDTASDFGGMFGLVAKQGTSDNQIFSVYLYKTDQIMPSLFVRTWTSRSSASSDHKRGLWMYWDGYFRIEDDGTDVVTSFSRDGEQWVEIDRRGNSALPTATGKVGFMLNASTDSLPVKGVVHWALLEVTEAP